jgi:hypothetical protein
MSDISMSSGPVGTKRARRAAHRSAMMIASRREAAGAGSGNAAAPGIAGWLSVAAAPAFATMALLAGVDGGGTSDVLCSAAHGASPLSGMVPMYLLMSAFHSAPWLKLISRWRIGCVKSNHASFGGTKARSRLGFIARGAIAISAATAPSANGPASEALATSPPSGPPTATPKSHADVTAPKAAVRSRGSAASVTRLVTLGISRESPAPVNAVEAKASHSTCVRNKPASPSDSTRKADRSTRLAPKRSAYPLPRKRVIINAMPNTVSAKFWPAKPRAAKRGTRNAAMIPYPMLANTPEAPGTHAALGNKARRIFVPPDETRP